MKNNFLLGNPLPLFRKLNSDDKSNATKTNLNVEKACIGECTVLGG